jgi:hypothetical protein
MMIARTLALTGLILAALGAAAVAPALAQEPRLQGRLPDEARMEVNRVLSAAREAGLPTEPLVDRALEGASKGATGPRIVTAVQRLEAELRAARDALGPHSTDEEIVAGASALRAGASPADLARLRRARTGRTLTVASAVLADLVSVGVPVDTAVSAVIALAGGAADADYIAFRRNVEQDVALGASPVAALGVRLDAAADMGDLGQTAGPGGRTGTPPRKP